jgi:hypothetical protein
MAVDQMIRKVQDALKLGKVEKGGHFSTHLFRTDDS